MSDAEVKQLRAQVDYLERLADAILTVHEQVVMDTPEDRDLHEKACATFRRGLRLLRPLAAAPPQVDDSGDIPEWEMDLLRRQAEAEGAP